MAAVLLTAGLAMPQAVQDRLAPANANEARLNRLQPPAQVMDIIGLKAGMSVAEIGAGGGRYVVHLADRGGPEGKVYAEDIDADALKRCTDRCRRGGFENVATIVGDLADPKLPSGALDLIFIISSYHHFGDPVALMSKAREALKTGGRAAIAEWIPPANGRGEGTTPEAMKAQMEKAGFRLEHIDRTFDADRMLIYLFRQRRS
jgi:ubiquinone/menaquinone biosynthesis C-methylase UbiE